MNQERSKKTHSTNTRFVYRESVDALKVNQFYLRSSANCVSVYGLFGIWFDFRAHADAAHDRTLILTIRSLCQMFINYEWDFENSLQHSVQWNFRSEITETNMRPHQHYNNNNTNHKTEENQQKNAMYSVNVVLQRANSDKGG